MIVITATDYTNSTNKLIKYKLIKVGAHLSDS